MAVTENGGAAMPRTAPQFSSMLFDDDLLVTTQFVSNKAKPRSIARLGDDDDPAARSRLDVVTPSKSPRWTRGTMSPRSCSVPAVPRR